MKKKAVKLLVLTLMCGALTVALGACSGDKTSENSSQITIGIPQDIENSLDPHKSVAAGTSEVLFNLYEGLVKPDSSGALKPAAASSYEISEDGTTYTFTLREGMKFHDGSPVTVGDVQYSISRCADTGNEQLLIPAYTNIQRIDTPDDKTIVITLSEPNTDFLSYMTTAIIPQSNENPDTNPIGTGPYKYVSRSPQENFVVEKFADYWGTPANIEHVTFKVCSNVDTIVMDLLGGSIDMYSRVTAAQADQLSDEFQILEGTMNLVQAMYLNNEAEPFNDLRVRQALCYAVDKQGIMDIIAQGKGTAIGSSMFPAFEKYYMPELADAYPYDTQKAKELLKEAGYADGLEFTLTVPSNYQQHVDTAQVVVEQLKEAGVNATINLIEWESWLSEVYTDRKYQATIVGVDASTLTARALLERFNSTAPNNFANYKNAAYDSAFAEATKTVDDEKQTAAYKQCETILSQDAANVYIQDLANLVALNKRYTGYEFYPLYVLDVSTLRLADASK